MLIDGLSSAIDILKAGGEEEEIAEGLAVPDRKEKGPLDELKGPIRTDVKFTEQVDQIGGGTILLPPGGKNAYYTLEFSTDMRNGTPGRLRYYSSPIATPLELVTNLITPTSMARDGDTGNIFITNIGPGTVTKVTFP